MWNICKNQPYPNKSNPVEKGYGYSKILHSPWALRIVPIWCKVPREPLTICWTFGTPSGDRDHRGPPGTTGDRRHLQQLPGADDYRSAKEYPSCSPALTTGDAERWRGEWYPNSWFVSCKIPLKWMIWGYPHFRKPPNRGRLKYPAENWLFGWMSNICHAKIGVV